MAQVIVTVNKRPYTMQCEDGEEPHLEELAQLLDSEVAGIRGTVGPVGDIRLLLMAGLVVADRLSEALKRVEELQEQVVGLRGSKNTGKEIEEKASERLDVAAKRLDSLAREMNGAG